jgi:penicillin V acylase-like amidase (Ntn superfamily)
MKIRLVYSALYLLLICLIPKASHSCTTFCLDKSDHLLFGRNYDWMVDECLVLINKRGVKKTAFTGHTKDIGQPARWTSKYGSITFNQYGRELPSGGMNETGLVVEFMGLGGTEHPAPDSRPIISPLQWQQYQLDNFSTVEEVIASDSQIRIEELSIGLDLLHYLVCDRMRNCAIIEFLEGKMVCYTKETMPIKVLTNTTYKESLEFRQKGKRAENNLGRSVERFSTVADMIERYDVKSSKSAIDYSFDILEKVAARGPFATEWSNVYDIKNLRIHFRTLENQNIRHIDLTHFDFSCKTPVKVFDIQNALSGDVTKNFIDYSQQTNQHLVRNVFKKTTWTWFLRVANDNRTIHPWDNTVPENLVNLISQYPETTICTE